MHGRRWESERSGEVRENTDATLIEHIKNLRCDDEKLAIFSEFIEERWRAR